jgi:hypothetical protein
MGMLKHYTKEVEQLMKDFFNSLSEKDKRRYAAVEAQKLGRAGIILHAGIDADFVKS